MMMWASYEKKIIFFASLKSMKKEVGFGVGCGSGAGSISQRYGSGDPDPDPHQNVTDPQHCIEKGSRKGGILCHPLEEETMHCLILLRKAVCLKILLERALFALVIWWRSADHICSCQMLYSMQRSRTRHTPSLECRQDRQIPATQSIWIRIHLNPDPDRLESGSSISSESGSGYGSNPDPGF
jgi:hypothetical protein